jgi:hypothetical protein
MSKPSGSNDSPADGDGDLDLLADPEVPLTRKRAIAESAIRKVVRPGTGHSELG